MIFSDSFYFSLADLIGLIVSRNPETYFPRVIQHSVHYVREEIEQGFVMKRHTTKSNNQNFIWYLHVLSGATFAARNSIHMFKDDLLLLLDSVLRIRQKDCQKAGRRFIKHFLANTWSLSWTSIKRKQSDLGSDYSLLDSSPNRCGLYDLTIQWYIPDSVVAQLGFSIAHHIITYISEQTEYLTNSTSPIDWKDHFIHCLRLLVLMAKATRSSSLFHFYRINQQRK